MHITCADLISVHKRMRKHKCTLSVSFPLSYGTETTSETSADRRTAWFSFWPTVTLRLLLLPLAFNNVLLSRRTSQPRLLISCDLFSELKQTLCKCIVCIQEKSLLYAYIMSGLYDSKDWFWITHHSMLALVFGLYCTYHKS